jgi:hypothetical protein
MLPMHYFVQTFYAIRVTSLQDSHMIGDSKPFRIARTFSAVSAENVKLQHFLHEKFRVRVVDQFYPGSNVQFYTLD